MGGVCVIVMEGVINNNKMLMYKIWSFYSQEYCLIVATRCHILQLKCTKFDFGWGYAPDPAGGAYSAPPDPLAGFKGPYF